jgi:hypothetical protein
MIDRHVGCVFLDEKNCYRINIVNGRIVPAIFTLPGWGEAARRIGISSFARSFNLAALRPR